MELQLTRREREYLGKLLGTQQVVNKAGEPGSENSRSQENLLLNNQHSPSENSKISETRRKGNLRKSTTNSSVVSVKNSGFIGFIFLHKSWGVIFFAR